jgi:FixJ family two-component response regulator
MLPELAAKATYGGLTRREREVAAQLVLGKTNREIAETLDDIAASLGVNFRAQRQGDAITLRVYR